MLDLILTLFTVVLFQPLINKMKYFELYEERAAIMQYDSGLSQSEAETQALIDTKDLIIGQNGVANPETYNFINKLERYIKSNKL